MSDAIVAEGLTKRFGGFLAVDGVSFAVPSGSVFGLLGANGAGKSTTIRMLCGLLSPSGGRASVAGLDVASRPEEVKRSIGYMSQKFSLYEDLTARENVEFFAGLYGIGRSARRRECDRVLEMAGLEGREDELSRELPGGFRQRLALGCALLHRPAVLFLDEPTAGVDPVARRRFWDVIYGLTASGSTVLVTTHYLDEAEYCSTVTLMRDGRVVASGSPGELKAERFPGLLLEIEHERPADVLAALSGAPGVADASLFGSRVHAGLAPGAGPEAALRALEAAGLGGARTASVRPSLEDVFIRVVSGKAEP
ncbi:MAG TPA: ABC transporter ATP-binding protein [Spirochaetia bacterium]|nr:ABC transporter ATP-binding protein [Spirochaetales bacterium]HRY72480.1 ABC transporter ATP-binding protein [Spirochaetia bacterium]